MESRLREMAERGELSGLPGEGRPLPLQDDGDRERWAAAHVMQNAGVAPEWSEVRVEIDRQRVALVGRARRHLAWLRSRASHLRSLSAEHVLDAAKVTSETDARVRADLAAALDELNALVRRYDLIVPVAALQLSPFTLDAVLAEAERGPH